MKKKLIIIIILLALIIGFGVFFVKRSKDDNLIKLSSKYYNTGEFIRITSQDIKALSNDTYLLFTYNNYCALKIPCDQVFQEFMKEYKIDIVSMPIDEFKETDFYKTVLYAPSVLVIKKGKIIAYLDANSDEDLDKYQDSKEFTKWVKNYISLDK